MKKCLSLILAVLMTGAMAVVGFAANKANFSITPVSETDKELVISIDYNGGSTFSCFDFELSVNTDKLEIEKSEEGKGLKNFNEYATSKGSSAFPLTNVVNKGLLKASFISLTNYQTVNGKDIFVITMKKLKSDKVTKSDVTLKFTSCAMSDANSNVTEVTPVITSNLGSAEQTVTNTQNPTASTAPMQTPTQADEKISSAVADVSGTVSAITDESVAQSADDTVATQQEKDAGETNETAKTVVIVVACVVGAALVATAIIIIVKKKKSEV